MLKAFPLLLLFLIATQAPPHPPAPLTTQVDAIFAPWNSENAPGAAVLVIKNGRKVFERGYGVSDLPSHRHIDAHTNFRLASLTKQFTATAIMLLVHDGKLRYEDRLTDLFPDFPEYGRAITIRNLLNHTSGLLDYEDIMAQQYGNTPPEQIPQIKDAGVLQLLKQQNHTKFTPGTKWDYSNSGYAVLAMVVEKRSGKPFGQFLHDRIFVPLQMNQTIAYEKGKNEVANRAYGYTKEADKWRDTDQSPTSAVLGDGGIYTSLEDMAKWDEALRHHTLLTTEEMQPSITPVNVPAVAPDGSPTGYGFGWFLDFYKGHARMWHYGETVGFRTAIQHFRDTELTVIVLCNRADADATGMALKIADLYLRTMAAR
jgi:CubicO group peptidase (beta-lactamase class C family)